MTAEMALILAEGMIFPGNGALLSGSITGGVLAEKSPVRWAAVGTRAVLLAPRRVRRGRRGAVGGVDVGKNPRGRGAGGGAFVVLRPPPGAPRLPPAEKKK